MKNTFFFLIFFPLLANAQALLTPDDAISIGLENNLGIQAAKMQTEVANLQVFRGNAGMQPKIDWNTNFGGAFNNIIQKLSNGTETNRFAQSLTPTSNVVFSWTLYDGRRMYAIYDRLKNQGQLSQLQTQLKIENTVADILGSYYQVMLQKQLVKYLETIIKQYEERLKITENRWEFGKGSKIDFLQSKNDLNAQVVLLNNAKNALRNAKVALNQLLARNLEQEFDVLDTINLVYNPNLDELKTAAKANNKNLQIVRKSIDINRISEQEVTALKKPRITLNSNYGYSLSKSNAGLFLLNQNLGLSAGVGMSWNIFNGSITRKQIQTARMNTEITQKQQLDLQSQIDAGLVQAFNQYQTDKQNLTLEEDNNKLAEENLKIALEKFRLGGSTILDIIEAQRSFDTSLNRLVNARYNIKISELDLMLLSGELVK